MELVDNGHVAIPGAMDAPLNSLLFWSSWPSRWPLRQWAFPVNRHLIARGRGMLCHQHHHH
jgi:hypothetical protein